LYEYGARWYDPAIGRFIGVDPIADQFPWVSTYNYAENEPIANIDLHGLQKVSVHLAGTITYRDPQSNKSYTGHLTAAVLMDQGNNDQINFGISLDGRSVGGQYNSDGGFELGVGDSEFSNQVVKTIQSGEKAGIGLPGGIAGDFLDDSANKILEGISDDNSELKNLNLKVGAKALEMMASDISSGDVKVRYSRDGATEIANNGNGNYKRKLTNKFSLFPKENLNFSINENASFEGKVLIQYTQQKCLENCNNE
jgi:hypothetical protein